MFMRKLLVDGYGLESDWTTRIRFVSRVGGSSVGWSRGYMVEHASADDVNYTQDRYKYPMSHYRMLVPWPFFYVS